MRQPAKNITVTVFLVFAFLVYSGSSFGAPQGEEQLCCEKESQEEPRNSETCAGTDCLCISCIPIAPGNQFYIDNSPLVGAAVHERARTLLVSGHSRLLERPPQSC